MSAEQSQRPAIEDRPSRRIAEFINVVRKMRDLQLVYYKTRDPNVLARCKVAERLVDEALRAFNPRELLF